MTFKKKIKAYNCEIDSSIIRNILKLQIWL